MAESAGSTYVAPGKVTALQHELRDDAVELGVLVAEALLASAKGTEVLGCLGDDIVEELEVDAAVLLCRDGTLAIAQRGESATRYSFATAAATAPEAEQSSAARHGGAGQLTLDGADVGDVAALVDGDLGTGPVDIEVGLDNHVGGRGGEEALVDGGLEAERVDGGAAEGREDSRRSRHGGARGVVGSCKQLACMSKRGEAPSELQLASDETVVHRVAAAWAGAARPGDHSGCTLTE